MNDVFLERLERLERANRWLRATVSSLAVLVLLLIGIGATSRDARSLDADRLTLRDPDGIIRARLAADESGPALVFLAKDASERLRFQALDDDPELLILRSPSDATKHRTVAVRMTNDGWATLNFLDSGKQERATLGLAYDGEPRLRMYSKDGKPRASLASDASGRLDFVLCDDGKERALLRLAPDGTPTLTLFDAESKKTFQAP